MRRVRLVGYQRPGVDAGGGDELVGHRRRRVEGHAGAHAVSDADLRAVRGGRIVRDRLEHRLGVGDHRVRLDALDHAHQPGTVRLVAHPREVERQPLAGAVEEVGGDAEVAVGREPAGVLLDLVAVADAVHVQDRDRERAVAVRVGDERRHLTVGGRDLPLLLVHVCSFQGCPRRRGVAPATAHPASHFPASPAVSTRGWRSVAISTRESTLAPMCDRRPRTTMLP